MTASTRPHDKGGSRPDQQRKRVEIRGPRHALIGVLAAAAVGLIAIGTMVLVRGDGGSVRLSDNLLAGSPLSFRALAMILVVVGATQVIAAIMLVLHHPRGRHVAAAAGVLVALLAAILVMLMAGTSWLPVALFGVAFMELLLVAASTPRKPMVRKSRFGRR
ncbi:MAG: hypothetical protein H0T89_33065 [Deltaproteobacteria bacterium]|nr:hypothetical protein [Deltaproteobacteria bacterium]MDQ3300940.1 hypothetical protein [Myxococcota bacterium]